MEEDVSKDNMDNAKAISAAVAKDEDEEDDGTTCPICFDPWTSSGEHRVSFQYWQINVQRISGLSGQGSIYQKHSLFTVAYLQTFCYKFNLNQSTDLYRKKTFAVF
jgi:hypothetical protein